MFMKNKKEVKTANKIADKIALVLFALLGLLLLAILSTYFNLH